MANRNVFRRLKDSAGANIEGQTKTATFNSESFNPKDFEEIGLTMGIDLAAGTCVVTLFYSPDGGTTWYSYPAAENSETQAGVSSISADYAALKYWKNHLQVTGVDGTNMLMRFTFTLATSPNMDFDFCYLSLRYVGH